MTRDRLRVGGHSREEVAGRAGVDPDFVDRLVELGILKPEGGDGFSPGDVRRARWIQSLERAGVPLEGMAAAVRDGVLTFSYLDATAFDRFAGLSSTTFRELSERTGVPLDLLQVVREALGFAAPHPEDHVREDELAVVPAIELQLASGIRPEVIKRLLRAYGDSLRRIVDTETDWYRTEVEQPLLEEGMTEAEMLAAQADIGSRMAPLMEQALVAIYHGHQEHAWSQSAVEDVEAALETGRAVPTGAPAAGHLLPGHLRVHAADRGTGRRGRRRPGDDAGRPGPAGPPRNTGASRSSGSETA